MTPDDLRLLMEYLQNRVYLSEARAVAFDLPSQDELLAVGLHPDAVEQVLSAPWLGEMVDDILETPDFCSPDEGPDQILRYARDVVVEYLRKRFQL
jgi:hypothetical protein